MYDTSILDQRKVSNNIITHLGPTSSKESVQIYFLQSKITSWNANLSSHWAVERCLKKIRNLFLPK